jgi:hypothetical protein
MRGPPRAQGTGGRQPGLRRRRRYTIRLDIRSDMADVPCAATGVGAAVIEQAQPFHRSHPHGLGERTAI